MENIELSGYQEPNKKVNPKKQARLTAELRKPSSGRQIEKIARRFGIGIDTGGREGTYLVAENRTRWPLTYHPRDVATGTHSAIRKFILQGAPTTKMGAR